MYNCWFRKSNSEQEEFDPKLDRRVNPLFDDDFGESLGQRQAIVVLYYSQLSTLKPVPICEYNGSRTYQPFFTAR